MHAYERPSGQKRSKQHCIHAHTEQDELLFWGGGGEGRALRCAFHPIHTPVGPVPYAAAVLATVCENCISDELRDIGNVLLLLKNRNRVSQL